MTPHRDTIIDLLGRHLAEDGGFRLYALLDCARDERILPALKASGHKKNCLYRGAPPELEAVAPWVVDLEHGGTAFLEWVVGNGWGQSWGIFLISPASLGELRKHFRRFLQVFTEDGRRLYFRYQDPRVLRPYLPTCTPEELDFVVGPVSWILLEGADWGELQEYCLDEEDGLSKHTIRFGGEIAPAKPELPADVAAVLTELEASGGDGRESLHRVRDVLAAHPGQSELLAFLRELSGRRYAPARLEASQLRDALGSLTDRRFEVESLQPLLADFSHGSWRAAFAALAPDFQSWLRSADRRLLAGRCRALIDLARFEGKARDLWTRLREANADADTAAEERAATVTLAELKAMQTASAKWVEDDPRLGKVHTSVERLAGRLEDRLSPRSAASGLRTLLVTLGRGDPHEAARVARGVVSALAGTEPSDAGNGGAPVEAPALEPRSGRYTTRRKALPFERERLVIRNEQMQTLAEANWRDRAKRLRGYARQEHPEQVAELGGDRLAEIVDRCLEKAAEQGIGKMGAITILLDLMITIDPEFNELEEYAWTDDVLTSDMLDPNSKPALIRDHLGG